jgi:hypothetical protein
MPFRRISKHDTAKPIHTAKFISGNANVSSLLLAGVTRMTRTGLRATCGVWSPRHWSHLLKGPDAEDHTLYASHTVWENRAVFEAWTKSDAFRAAHSRAGDNKPRFIWITRSSRGLKFARR